MVTTRCELVDRLFSGECSPENRDAEVQAVKRQVHIYFQSVTIETDSKNQQCHSEVP